jgi:hypothetical protein
MRHKVSKSNKSYRSNKSHKTKCKNKRGSRVIKKYSKQISKKHRKNVGGGGDEDERSAAASTLRKFMNRNKVKIRHNFLTNVCADSGQCMAIGREMRVIREYFDGFSDFHYLQSPIKRIGKSTNGIVHELKYTRDNYSSYAVLKSANTSESDNLVYEYMVGQYINKLCNYFPCFLETYGLYYYKDEDAYRNIIPTASSDSTSNPNTIASARIGSTSNQNIIPTASNDNNITADDLRNSLIKETGIDYEKACTNSKYAAILIQHVNNAKTFFDLFMDEDLSRLKDFFDHLPYILFQIYYTLNELSYTFTHYDLHGNNILLYELEQNKYIQYHYYYQGAHYKFKSKYIIKIIDYGRSFFNDVDSGMNSAKIREELCKTSKCDPECGKMFGFENLTGKASCEDYYIDSTQANRSHDLKLLSDFYIKYHDVRCYFKNMDWVQPKKELWNLLVAYDKSEYNTEDDNRRFGKLVYGEGYPYENPECKYARLKRYNGTQQADDNYINGPPNFETIDFKTINTRIQTVYDAFVELSDIITSPRFFSGDDNNDSNINSIYYETYSLIGHLHVYGKDTPMKYIPEKLDRREEFPI